MEDQDPLDASIRIARITEIQLYDPMYGASLPCRMAEASHYKYNELIQDYNLILEDLKTAEKNKLWTASNYRVIAIKERNYN